MNTKPDREAEIEARLKAATPGPWELWTGCSWRRIGKVQGDRALIEPTNASDGHPDLRGVNLYPDLDLCVNAPTDLSYLLEENRRLRGALELVPMMMRESTQGDWEVEGTETNEVYNKVLAALNRSNPMTPKAHKTPCDDPSCPQFVCENRNAHLGGYSQAANTPSRERLEAARKILDDPNIERTADFLALRDAAKDAELSILRSIVGDANSKSVMRREVAQGRVESWLAARDAETIRPWREAVILAERWFDSSRVNHHRDCAGASPVMKCDCGVRGMTDKFSALLSSHPVPNKGESR